MKIYLKFLNPVSLAVLVPFIILLSCNEDDDERQILNDANVDLSSSIVMIDSGLSIVGLGLTGQLTATIDQNDADEINNKSTISGKSARTAVTQPKATSKEVKWSSSNEDIATVDQNGLVTGKAPGEVSITATSVKDNMIVDSRIILVTNGQSDIKSFVINGVEGVIDGTNITVSLPGLSDVMALKPSIKHTGYLIAPGNEEAQDFSKPVAYTVFGKDGSSLKWTASVSTELNERNVDGAFVTTWDAQEITIPTDDNYEYNYNVDWDNDGIMDETGITGNITHTFDTDDKHTIRIIGTFPAINFGKLPEEEAAKIISVDYWGNIEWHSMFDAFANCSRLEVPATDAPDLSKTNRTARMFRNASLANPDVSEWNMSNVRNMNAMFHNASSANPDVSQWNFSQIIKISNMFLNSGLTQENYEKALIRWAAHDSISDLSLVESMELGSVPATYCDPMAIEAKALLLSKDWTINDQGESSECSQELEGFITTWSGQAITIPINSTEGFTYNYNVDWDNDGTIDETGITGNVTHTFEDDGEHTIRITGTFPAIQFATVSAQVAGMIISVDQWGNNEWLSMKGAFQKCINLEIPATDIPDLSRVTSLESMFMGAIKANPDVSNWNTANVTNMRQMFRGTMAANPDVSNWNTEKVTMMMDLFHKAQSANPDVSNWNISNVANLKAMFNGAGMTQENYEKALIRFAEHDSDPNLTLPENLHLGNPPFAICSEESQVARNLLLSKGWTIVDRGLDPSCSQVKREGFITTWKGKTITIPINTAEDLTYDYNVDWDNDGTIDQTGITGDVTHTFAEDGEHTIRITGTFPAIRFGPRTGETVGPYWENAAKIISIDQWGTNEWLSFASAFNKCVNLALKATDVPDLSKVTSLASMFIESGIGNTDFRAWNTSNVTNMGGMFAYTHNATQLNVSTWNTANVTSMSGMFGGAASNPDVSNWNTSKVINMGEMFHDATNANPDLSNWNFSSVGASRPTLDIVYIFKSSGISQENYEKFLIRLAAHDSEAGLTLAENIKLGDVPVSICSEETQEAKALLLSKGWNIEDQGVDPSCPNIGSEGFITTWKGREITIAINRSIFYTYNYNVDWDNDGIIDQTGITGNVSHTFDDDGKHTIRITGAFPAIQFKNLSGQEAEKLISIDQWGSNEWLSMSGAFQGCSNLEVLATDIPDLSQVTSLNSMFKSARGVIVDVSQWNTSNITNTGDMFRGIDGNPDISNWNTSQLNGSLGMFQHSQNANPDVSNWNISNWGNGNIYGPHQMFDNTGFSQGNYEKALIRFAAHESDPNLILPENIDLGNIPTTICSEEAQAAKTLLLSKGWIINDQGIDPACLPAPGVVPEFRQNLSELNLFEGNMNSLTPSSKVFEYELNTQLFTDYAKKQRLISIPEGAAMTSNGDGLPDYPDNTVMAKTFYYYTDDRTPSIGKKIIETRVLIKKNGQWKTGNYKWNAAQTDATYTQSSSDLDITFINNEGETTTFNYVIPGEDDCFMCHQTYGETTPIGPKLRNMNKLVNGKNQIQSLMDMQWLNGVSHPSNITKLPDWEDTGETLENRARAYFEVNCAHCHTDGGYMSFINLSFETPFNDTPLQSEYYQGRIPQVIESGYMPYIGTNLVHEEGLDLVKEYLEGL